MCTQTSKEYNEGWMDKMNKAIRFSLEREV